MFCVNLHAGGRRFLDSSCTDSAADAVVVTLSEICRVVMLCSSTADAMVLDTSLTCLITSLIALMESNCFAGRSLHGFDASADVVRRSGRLLCNSLTSVATTQNLCQLRQLGLLQWWHSSKQVGLFCNVLDDFNHLTDFVGCAAKLLILELLTSTRLLLRCNRGTLLLRILAISRIV